MPVPQSDTKLDRRTWRDRTGRRGQDLRAVFAWLCDNEPTVWWSPDTIADALRMSRRRAIIAVETLVGELAVQRGIREGARRYRAIVW